MTANKGGKRVVRPPELRRTKQVSTTMTPRDAERVRAAALETGRITSEFVRDILLAETARIERKAAKLAQAPGNRS